MDIQEYFDQKKELQNILLSYIENEDQLNCEIDFNRLTNYISEQKYQKDRQEMNKFLGLLLSISNNHHRQTDFFHKIKRILHHYEAYIKQSQSNYKIFHFFSSNKLIIHFLFQEGIIFMEESIFDFMMRKKEGNGIRYCHFFIPEIKKFIGEAKASKLENEVLNINSNNLDNYEEKRQIGENDSYICALIRQDSVEEFISHVTKENIPLSSKIKPSIFETIVNFATTDIN